LIEALSGKIAAGSEIGREAVMDRQAVRRKLLGKAGEAIDKAMDAVEAAPDGRWIAGSEWAVRGAFQELMQECFQEVVQAKIDSDPDPAASAGSFSPGARPGHDGAVQEVAAARRAQRRR
jgi:hypothetical protein